MEEFECDIKEHAPVKESTLRNKPKVLIDQSNLQNSSPEYGIHTFVQKVGYSQHIIVTFTLFQSTSREQQCPKIQKQEEGLATQEKTPYV